MESLDACSPCFIPTYALATIFEVNCDVKHVGEFGVLVDFFLVRELGEMEVMSWDWVQPLVGEESLWNTCKCMPQGVQFYDFIPRCVYCMEFGVSAVLLHGRDASMFLKHFVDEKTESYERHDVYAHNCHLVFRVALCVSFAMFRGFGMVLGVCFPPF